MHGPFVPTRIVKRYIAAWLSLDDERTYMDVMHVTGVNVRTIHAIMVGERESMWFDTADIILCKLGYELAWHHDEELAHIYAAA